MIAGLRSRSSRVSKSGTTGIGVISDYEDQPIMVTSHLGRYAIVTVGVIQNADEIVASAFKKKSAHFAEISHGHVNPTEVVATLINQEDSFAAGLSDAGQQDHRLDVGGLRKHVDRFHLN